MANEKWLIDANALIDKHTVLWDEALGFCACVLVEDIDNAPTVDAVEVTHGRWIRRGNEMKCSKCEFIYYSNHDDFNYCPNCGAKMDGDGNG